MAELIAREATWSRKRATRNRVRYTVRTVSGARSDRAPLHADWERSQEFEPAQALLPLMVDARVITWDLLKRK